MLPSVRIRRCVAVATLVFCSLLSLPSHGELIISEFMAENDSGLTDVDGDNSDWIEIHNPGPTAQSTDGYYLTDNANDLIKWRLPDVNINVGGFLVVFASEKDRSNPLQQLHTNFRLDSNGEYLALVKPDGVTTVQEFAPEYPEQYEDISYGVGNNGIITAETFVALDADAKYLVPEGDLAEDWRVPAFDDAAWTGAKTAIGFGYPTQPIGAGGDVGFGIMRNNNASIYVRIPFQLDDPAGVLQMVLRMKWEDGFVAYLNGQEIESQNDPTPLTWNSEAIAHEEVEDEDDFISYPINFAGKLVAGTNILAFQGLNKGDGSSDFLLYPLLEGEVQDLSQPTANGFIETPSPGNPNGVVLGPPPAEVVYSETTKTFSGSFSLTLSAPTPGATIRYTTDGSKPSNDLQNPSPAYSGPINIGATTQVRAEAFVPGTLRRGSQTEAYFRMPANERAVTSNLPIVLIDSFGRGAPFETSSTDRRLMIMAIFEPKGDVNPRAAFTNAPDLVSRVGVRKRGSSTGGAAKYSMSVEAWTENDWEERTIRPLGFGGEDDWIMSGRYQFDRALIRNPLIYELSRQIGRYASRTRFVELYNNSSGGDVAGSTDYFGVYSFMEKLDRDDDRIDVESLNSTVTTEPDITGGYIFKNDRSDPGEPTFPVNWGNGGSDNLVHIYPDGAANPRRPEAYFISPTQRTWLINHLNEIGVAVAAGNGINPSTGLHFSDYIDVDSFIDHMWLNALMMNVDWGRLSAWYFKPRNEKLNGGPVWDFDRSAGSEDGRDSTPVGWNPSGDSKIWYDGQYPWYGKILGFHSNTNNPSSSLSNRPDYFQRAVDRWFELRRYGAFSDENIVAVIDSMADEISEAQARNFAKWGNSPFNRAPNGGSFAGGVSGWAGEIAHLKGWLTTGNSSPTSQGRTEWIDAQFVGPPEYNVESGIVLAGTPVTITSDEGTIYYTTDGSDPRAPGGGISNDAVEFSGGAATATTLIAADASCRYFVPDDGSLGLTWTGTGFNDDSWTSATNAPGFETPGQPLAALVGTDIKFEVQPPDDDNKNGFYTRFEFELPGGFAGMVGLDLGMVWDDGFVAYLNGVELSTPGNNAPAAPQWDSRATSSSSESTTPTMYDLSANITDLRVGTNVLAIHAMNRSSGSSDLLVRPTLTADVATPLAVNETTTFIARAKEGTEWSAPTQVTLVVGSELANSSNLVISELMYNPEGPNAAEMQAGFLDGDVFEFVELENISNSPVDLSEVSFTEGIQFDFALSNVTMLMPGERVLVVKNQAAFEERYGNGMNDRIAGVFADTNLRDSGERLLLVGNGGATIRDFSYGDRLPWPESPDGDGPSLVLINPTSNPDHGVATNWRASAAFNGNPNASDTGAPFAGIPDADEDNDGLNAFTEHALGTIDTDAASGPASVTTSLDLDADGYHLRVSHRVNLAAEDVVITPEVSTNMEDWTVDPLALEAVTEVHNGDGTSTVTYEATAPVTTGPGFYVRLRVNTR